MRLLVFMHAYTGDERYRKEKHKVVEQKRREKTKELLSDLQELLPNLDSSNPSAQVCVCVCVCVKLASIFCLRLA